MHTRMGVLVVVGLIWITGCVTGINEDMVRLQTLAPFEKYGEIRKVAIIPFGEYVVTGGEKVVMGVPHRVTEDNGKVMCDIFTEELKPKVTYQVIPPDKVAQFFRRREEKVWGMLLPKEVQRVGALLKADALIMGQVQDFSTYRYRMHGNSRVIAQIRMTDSATAEPIWRGDIKLDQEGMPHEVAARGARLFIDQLMSRKEAEKTQKRKALPILNR
ncbi:MAG: hypothetical protein NTX71_00720 [Candidatus Aureabacteria bacterium]|nr:hypothetical protein [Candidatus Auribacterota bacterium]